MFTPGIGPATDGLSGLELFEVSPAVSEQTADTPMASIRSLRIGALLGYLGTGLVHDRHVSVGLSAGGRTGNRSYVLQGSEIQCSTAFTPCKDANGPLPASSAGNGPLKPRSAVRDYHW